MKNKSKPILDRSRLSVVLIGFLIILTVLTANIIIFKNYEEVITRLQQENLLTIAKTVAGSLEAYYENCRVHFATYFDAIDSPDETAHYFGAQQDGICAIYILSGQREIVRHFGEDYDVLLPVAFKAAEGLGAAEATWLPPLIANDNSFVQILYKQVALNDVSHYVLAFLEMETVYKRIVQPIRVGLSGYSMVKDNSGIILMHSAKNQIGLDAVQGRLELYKDQNLDLRDLESWVNEQIVGSEGARLLNSYWWDDPDVPPSQKLVAFTKITVGNDIWVVNSTLDYIELKAPIDQMRNRIGIMTAAVVLLFVWLTYMINNYMNREETMRIKISHLQELEKSNELLRHNERISTLGSMTSMIAHEFNNFLTPIQLYGELLLEGKVKQEIVQEYANEILEASNGAAELTKELSLYGRQDSDKKAEIALVKEQLQRSLVFIRKTLPGNVELSVDLQGDNPYVKVRRGVIKQIMINLYSNAVHAMAGMEGRLRVEGTVVQDEFQNYYSIIVEDNGCGMTEEVLIQVFQPFYTTKLAGSGTGLGLSIIKDIVQQAGGSITARSKVGEGSRFEIKLPLYNPEVVAQEGLSRPVSDGRALQVLILDDKRNVAKAIEKTLQEHYSVDLFLHPAHALAALSETPDKWDIILTDYSMPVLSGVEFAKIIRQQGVGAVILLMSGHTNLDIRQEIEEGIIDGFLEKPITSERFEQAFRQILTAF